MRPETSGPPRAERPGPSRSATALLMLIAAIALHLALIVRGGLHVIDLEHDSTISYLAATGHQSAYERLPTDAWTPARTWQRMFEVDTRWPVREIRDDLARLDVHPPLYFWLLHAQLLAPAATPWAFLPLNGVLGVFTILLIYSTGRRLWDDETAAGAALLWAVARAVLLTDTVARPYLLFGTLALLVVRLTLPEPREERTPSFARWAMLVGAMFAGLLTHYQFPIVLGAVATGTLVRKGDYRWIRVRTIALAIVAAVALALLANPDVLLAVRLHERMSESFALRGVPERVRDFAEGIVEFASPGPIPLWMLLTGGPLLAWGAWRRAHTGTRPPWWPRLQDASPGVAFVGWTLLATTVILAALYLGYSTPAHAVGGRYGAVVWPLLALMLARALRLMVPRPVVVPIAALAMFLVSWRAAGAMDATQRAFAASPELGALHAARFAVADHDKRGVLPRTVLHLAPDAALWVARDSTRVPGLFAELRARGEPATLLLNDEAALPGAHAAIIGAARASGTVDSLGATPSRTRILVWTPAPPAARP